MKCSRGMSAFLCSSGSVWLVEPCGGGMKRGVQVFNSVILSRLQAAMECK